jgi:hypothetical protein
MGLDRGTSSAREENPGVADPALKELVQMSGLLRLRHLEAG